MDVTIDSSAWGNLMRADVAALAVRLAQLEARLVLPLEVLAERLAEDRSAAWDRVSAIGTVARSIDVVVFPALKDVVARERRRRLQTSTPGCEATYTKQVLQCCQDPGFFDDNFTWLQQNMNEHLGKDDHEKAILDGRQRARAYVEAHPEMKRKAARTELGHNILQQLGRYPGQLLDSHLFAPVRCATMHASRMVRQPMLFPATLTWGICQDLTMLGHLQRELITPNGGPRGVAWLEHDPRTDSVDDRICTAAAYSRILVTDDGYQADKACFAATVLGRLTGIVSLHEFLGLSIEHLVDARRTPPIPLSAPTGSKP